MEPHFRVDAKMRNKGSVRARFFSGWVRAIFVIAAAGFFGHPGLTRSEGPTAEFTIARLKYGGGGDWYDGPSGTANLLRFLREKTGVQAAGREVKVGVMDEDLFSYPFTYMTGHGNVRFAEEETARLRTYLENGGFLFVNDDYGMDKAFRREVKRIFPDKDLIQIPRAHGIFHQPFEFPNGLPKIHEHDGGPPRAFGLFSGERLVIFYNTNTDIADGWDDPDVHKDPPEKRIAALKMGANIVIWSLTH